MDCLNPELVERLSGGERQVVSAKKYLVALKEGLKTFDHLRH